MNRSTIQSVPEEPPFESLAMLRRQHSVLLGQQRPTSKEDEHSESAILRFLGRAKATGRLVPDPESRTAIQGILDYWSAVLLSANPGFSDFLGALFPDDYEGDPSTATNPPPAAAPAPKAATDVAALREFSASLNIAESDTLRRLLPKMVRFSSGTDEFYLHPLPATDVGHPQSEEAQLLDKLLEANLVRIEGEGSTRSFVLSDLGLLKAWPELREICVQRRTFRGLGRRWDSGGRKAGDLLENGPQLAAASTYRDLLEYETTFLDLSRRASDSSRQRQLWVLGSLLGLISVLAIAFGLTVLKLRRTIADLKATQTAKQSVVERFEDSEYRRTLEQQSNEATLTEILGEVDKVKKEVSNASPESVAEELGKLVDGIKHDVDTGLPPPPPPPQTTNQPSMQKGYHPTLSETASDPERVDDWQSGKAHLFDIDNDSRIKPTDTLAIITRWSEADKLSPGIFKQDVDRGPRPLVRQLDRDALFLAARWDYKRTPRRWLLTHKIPLRNPRTGKIVEAQAVDWGPSAKDGHLVDLSPGLARALGINKNDPVEIRIPAPPAQ